MRKHGYYNSYPCQQYKLSRQDKEIPFWLLASSFSNLHCFGSLECVKKVGSICHIARDLMKGLQITNIRFVSTLVALQPGIVTTPCANKSIQD